MSELSELAVWMEKRTLTHEEIEKRDKEDSILVNVNRIYSKYAEVVRNNLEEEYGILSDIIDRIYDEKEMYTVMTARDVLTCFFQKTSEYPDNTFLSKYDKEKIE